MAVNNTKKNSSPTKAELMERLARLEALLGSQPIVEQNNEVVDTEIRPDEYIKVMSLCPVVLNLSTQAYGKGNVFRFKQFGEVKRIVYSDLVKIFEVHPNFLEEGFFYVMDRRVIRRHGLDDTYEKILTKEQFEKVIEGKSKEEALDIFRSANKRQREFIVEVFVGKVREGEEVDLNILDQISRIYGQDIKDEDFNIKKLGEESKKYLIS